MLRKVSIIAAVAGLLGAMALGAAPALAATHGEEPRPVSFSFDNPVFGKFDQVQLQRGYKIYREVCSACHAMSLVSFRNLGDKGGPFYDKKYPNSNDNPWVKA